MTIIKLEPTYKKSTVEIEFFKNEDNVWVHYETGWRWGTFYANVTDEELHDLQVHNEYCRVNNKWDEYEISTLTEFQMDNTWDGCWTDISVWKMGWSDEQRQELKETIEQSDDWWGWLEENGFEPQDCETYINGVIDIEVLDKLPWE